MAMETHEKREVTRESIPARVIADIEFKEFKVLAKDFDSGNFSCGPDMLHRMETGMGVSYNPQIMLTVMEILLKEPKSYGYTEIVKYHLQSLQYRVNEEQREKNKVQLAKVMDLAQKEGIYVKDPSAPILWKLICWLVMLPFVTIYKLISWIIKVCGKIIVWGITVVVVLIAFGYFGFTGAVVALIFMLGIFSKWY